MTVGPAAPSRRAPARTERPGVRSAGETGFLARVARAPVTWLAAIVGVSFVIRASLSLGAVSPWVLPDELVYSDLARSIAAGGRPAVRDVPVFGWGEVYPMLIAPVWALVDDRYLAYHATLVVNAIVMSLAAVPAYFLARLFVTRRSSLLVSLLTVVVPSLSYTGAVLTENAFYPLFLLSLLAIARAVRRPTLGAQAFALGALGVLAFTRIQGVAVLAAYVGAVLVYAHTTSSGRPPVSASLRPEPSRRRSGSARSGHRVGRTRRRDLRLARSTIRNVQRVSPGGGAPLVRVPRGGPRPLRRSHPGCRNRDRSPGRGCRGAPPSRFDSSPPSRFRPSSRCCSGLRWSALRSTSTGSET